MPKKLSDSPGPGQGATTPPFHVSAATAAALAPDFPVLTAENVKQELPRLLQSLVSPTSAEGQEALVRRQFAVHSRLSHPFGYAVGSAQIACMLTCMYLWRSILFPTVEILPICVLFDRERLTAALNVEGALRLRWLGLRVPLLAQFVIELAPRRERGAAPGTLCITYWDEHYSLRSLAVMLPGPLAWLVDWWCRRAVGVASERLLRLLTRMGMAPWSQLRQE